MVFVWLDLWIFDSILWKWVFSQFGIYSSNLNEHRLPLDFGLNNTMSQVQIELRILEKISIDARGFRDTTRYWKKNIPEALICWEILILSKYSPSDSPNSNVTSCISAYLKSRMREGSKVFVLRPYLPKRLILANGQLWHVIFQ